MQISLITICLNNFKNISRTIDSILNQTYKNYELIIIDGLSKDGTQNIILKKLKDKKLKYIFISEVDNGIYQAFNKGLELASGDIIGFVNGEDFLMNKDVLKNIALEFKNNNLDALVGNATYFNENYQKVIRYWKGKSLNKIHFFFGAMPHHQATYLRNSVYRNYGKYDERLKIAGDYDLFIKLFVKNNLRMKYVNLDIIGMKSGGISNSNLKNIIVSNIEATFCWKKYFGFPNIFVFFLKPISKLSQLFLKK